jgi:hypothetical protein
MIIILGLASNRWHKSYTLTSPLLPIRATDPSFKRIHLTGVPYLLIDQVGLLLHSS